MKTRLPTLVWGHAILHAASLVRLRPTHYHEFSPLQLVCGQEPNISHLRTFGCAVYVPVAPPQRSKMGPQRRLGIYVGFDSPSIIRYLEPMTGDLFTARFADCRFDETSFPQLGGEKNEVKREIVWKVPSLSHLDPRTPRCEHEIQKIIHLQNIANQMPDAFTDLKRITKSHIPAENAPIRVDVPAGPSTSAIASESKARQKRGRPLGSKDRNPRKRKTTNDQNDIVKGTPEESQDQDNEPETQVSEELLISSTGDGLNLNRSEIKVDNAFAYNVALEIMQDSEDLEPRSVEDCRHRSDWPKWQEAIQSELNSLAKREVFGPVVQTSNGVRPIGYKWVFVRKRNEKNEVQRYKAPLVAQGFSQRPGVDYEETY